MYSHLPLLLTQFPSPVSFHLHGNSIVDFWYFKVARFARWGGCTPFGACPCGPNVFLTIAPRQPPSSVLVHISGCAGASVSFTRSSRHARFWWWFAASAVVSCLRWSDTTRGQNRYGLQASPVRSWRSGSFLVLVSSSHPCPDCTSPLLTRRQCHASSVRLTTFVPGLSLIPSHRVSCLVAHRECGVPDTAERIFDRSAVWELDLRASLAMAGEVAATQWVRPEVRNPHLSGLAIPVLSGRE